MSIRSASASSDGTPSTWPGATAIRPAFTPLICCGGALRARAAPPQQIKGVNAGRMAVAPGHVDGVPSDDADAERMDIRRDRGRIQHGLAGEFVHATGARAPQTQLERGIHAV